jgi:hypothetical protein
MNKSLWRVLRGTISSPPVFSFRRRPMRWLILSGLVLIGAIAIGTALAIERFRDNAIENGKRELQGAVLLLVRHFDRQFDERSSVSRRHTYGKRRKKVDIA